MSNKKRLRYDFDLWVYNHFAKNILRQKKHSLWYKFIEVLLVPLEKIQNSADKLYLDIFYLTATSTALEKHAQKIGLQRLEAEDDESLRTRILLYYLILRNGVTQKNIKKVTELFLGVTPEIVQAKNAHCKKIAFGERGTSAPQNKNYYVLGICGTHKQGEKYDAHVYWIFLPMQTNIKKLEEYYKIVENLNVASNQPIVVELGDAVETFRMGGIMGTETRFLPRGFEYARQARVRVL